MQKVSRFPLNDFVTQAPDRPVALFSLEHEKMELQRVLGSRTFARSPRLARLLEFVCRKHFEGEAGQLREYTIAVELLGRSEGFQPRDDASIRVDMNRLRRQLRNYYRAEGRLDPMVISVPSGQYAPLFSPAAPNDGAPTRLSALTHGVRHWRERSSGLTFRLAAPVLILGVLLGILLGTSIFQNFPSRIGSLWTGTLASPLASAKPVGPPLPAGPELRILAGSPDERRIDHLGNVWLSDRFFTGGSRLTFPPQNLATSGDPEQVMPAYAREGDFTYHIPLAPGVYELRLHFMERADNRVANPVERKDRAFDVFINGRRLLSDFDIASDAGGVNVPDIKVFTDVSPASDGLLHMKFSSRLSKAMLSGIEVLPGIPGKIRPVRIACRPTPYTATDGIAWQADGYFRGGHLAIRNAGVGGTQDPALFGSERYGQFTYAIPVAERGLYTVVLGFAETCFQAAENGPAPPRARLFDVFCNGQSILKNFSIFREAGGSNRAVTRVFRHIEPTTQWKILLEFVPVTDFACINTIEVLSE